MCNGRAPAGKTRDTGGNFYLFTKNPLNNILQNLLTAATGKVEDFDPSALMANVDAPETVAREVLAEWPFEIPILNDAGIYTTHEEIRGEVRDPASGAYSNDSPIQQYIYHVPFSGNSSVFHMRPLMTLATPLAATISDSELQVEFREANPDADAIKATFEKTLSHVKSYLGWIETDLANGLAGILSSVTSAVQSRQVRLSRANLVASNLGYPLGKRSDALRIAVPMERRIIQTTQAKATITRSPTKPEPYLSDLDFAAILDVITSMSLLIERNPSTFARIPEETLRDHFLLQLNGQFQGRASGETFNVSGKTDILLREGDRNLFIAECKYWSGPKSLTDAIDQLLSYLSWRDSKGALLVFNRNRDFTRVIEEAGKALRSHPQFGVDLPTARDTSFRARMTHPNDKMREVDLIVLLFEVPARVLGDGNM